MMGRAKFILDGAVKIALLVALLIFFLGSGGGFVSALGERFGQDWSFGSSGGGRLDDGMNYQQHEKIYQADDAWLKAHREMHRQEVTYGNPKECTSKETWSVRCGYHR